MCSQDVGYERPGLLGRLMLGSLVSVEDRQTHVNSMHIRRSGDSHIINLLPSPTTIVVNLGRLSNLISTRYEIHWPLRY